MNNNTLLLIGRILLGLLFVAAGAGKLGGMEGVAGYIASKGLPMPSILAWVSTIFEIVAGICIIIGFKTKLMSYLLAAFCVLAAAIFHFDPSNQSEMTSFLKNLAIAGGFLALSVSGPGSMSVDAKRS
ncbi:MAG: DoxX family protein [Nitratireductor sp.]